MVESVSGIVRERMQGSGCQFNVDVETGPAADSGGSRMRCSPRCSICSTTPTSTRHRKSGSGCALIGEEGQVVFAVEDNGIGIAAREQKRIFRRFYQVDRRLARETGGCGLGLSIVDSIVRAHGGSVRVTSRLGGAARFACACRREKAAA